MQMAPTPRGSGTGRVAGAGCCAYVHALFPASLRPLSPFFLVLLHSFLLFARFPPLLPAPCALFHPPFAALLSLPRRTLASARTRTRVEPIAGARSPPRCLPSTRSCACKRGRALRPAGVMVRASHRRISIFAREKELTVDDRPGGERSIFCCLAVSSGCQLTAACNLLDERFPELRTYSDLVYGSIVPQC